MLILFIDQIQQLVEQLAKAEEETAKKAEAEQNTGGCS
jgi:hypothetical protein